MTFSLLLEAALRSLVLALAVWAGLRIFRVRNVPAQKAAWGVVLAAALAMPVVLPMASHWSVLPANVRVVIPADPQNLLEELQARIQADASSSEVKPSPAATVTPDPASGNGTAAQPVAKKASDFDDALTPVRSKAPRAHAIESLPPQPTANYESVPALHAASQLPASSQRAHLSILARVLVLYAAVAGVLLGRLAWGLILALRLWLSARPISGEVDSLGLHGPGEIRSSTRVASPVTICSTIVLPADYTTWDREKLRVVLAHERSHLRQRDFYLQLIAGAYAAVVWFSPLGWWLKRKLSDLAEAISDRAGLEEAADRTSYAQVLLEFAAAPRPTFAGVAMARRGSLSRRIEGLLNEVSFRQAFSGTRRSIAAVLVIPIALFAASTLIRVQAAGQAPQAPTAPQAPRVMPDPPVAIAPDAPSTGISTPEVVPDQPAFPALPAAANIAQQVAPVPPAAPAEPAEPASLTVTPAPASSQGLILAAPKAPNTMAKVMVLPDRLSAHPMVLIAPGASYGEGRGIGIGQSGTTETRTVSTSSNGKHSGYSYSYSSNGESYALITGGGRLEGTGSFNSLSFASVENAKKQAHGDFLWFTRGGKSYFVDDPSTVAQIEAMYKPMEELGRQQEELSKKQEELGKQQEQLGKQQEAASVPTPDMSKEIAKIDEAMAKLKASQGKNMTQDEFAELQERLGELQGRLGEIQGEIGEKQGEFGEKMGELGAKMGELGAQMGDLGARQGKIGEDADQKVRSIIDQSLKDGKAHPVQ